MGPGLRPNKRQMPFSVWAICISICGIVTAAVSYCVRACSTVMRLTCPYLFCNSKSFTDFA